MEKPTCRLIGQDGNIFNLAAIVMRTLREADLEEQADEVGKRLPNCESYHSALRMFMEFVTVE